MTSLPLLVILGTSLNDSFLLTETAAAAKGQKELVQNVP